MLENPILFINFVKLTATYQANKILYYESTRT